MMDSIRGVGSHYQNIFNTTSWTLCALTLSFFLVWSKYRDRRATFDCEKRVMEDRKAMYRQKRDTFNNNTEALKELEHWKARDSQYKYDVLSKGLIPSKLVGQQDFTTAFVKCDTWFSEYKSHNSASQIVHESAFSFIIGNLASYDKRQYPPWLDPKNKPGINTPEGQGFGHCLVIPKRRIFNIVDPEATANNCAVIKELRAHFIEFWQSADGAHALVQRTRSSFDSQNDKLEANIQLSPIDEYKELVPALNDDFNSMAQSFERLKVGDFQFGFHAFPDNSVGHLHMHVFPRQSELRKWSTRTHDWKTIPIEAVLEVEEEDQMKQ